MPRFSIIRTLALLAFALLALAHIALGASWQAVSAAPSRQLIALTPSGSITDALKRAQPGDTIQLADGLYKQDIVTDHGGQPGAPITLRGSRRAIIAGAGAARIIQLFHPFIALDGFTVDGTASGSQRDKGIYVLGQRPRTPLRGIRLVNLAVRNIGGECVRLRYYVQGAEIANNQLGPCGLTDFPGGKWGGRGKNGEGVYIGTAPEQRGQNGAPDSSPDQSDGNWIHDNAFDTQGNECVDIKEDASGNLVERNTCTGQRDSESAGFDSRGDANIFRSNTATGNTGAGFRLGGDLASQGVGNFVYDNQIADNSQGGLKVQRSPQGAICGNRGQTTSSGSFSNTFQPGAACDPARLPTITGPELIGNPGSTVSTPTPPVDETVPPLPTTPPTRTPRIPPSATSPPATTAVPATPTSGTTTPPPWRLRADAPLVIVAPQGRLAPDVFVVRNEGGRIYLTTSGRGKIEQDEKQGARYDLEVESAGRYVVWVLGRGHGDDANSVFVRAGDTGSVAVHFDDDGWRWERLSRSLSFAAGQTTLSLFPRERGTDIQALVITRDAMWAPPQAGTPPAPATATPAVPTDAAPAPTGAAMAATTTATTAPSFPNGQLVTFRPARIPFDAPELVNPLRGLYRWMGQEYAALPQPALDAYQRYTWRDLEPTEGDYRFTKLEQDIAQAAREGRKYAFRVRALVSEHGSSVPDYLMGRMSRGWWADYDHDGTKDTYVPDWNDAFFLERANALIAALGKRYDGDGRIAWVDIGLYGNWGEWHTASFHYPSPTGAERGTSATLHRIVDMYVAGFATTPLVMPTDNADALVYAMGRSPRIGWRRDSLGWNTGHFEKVETDPLRWNAIKDRWKTAPVITEFVNPRHQGDPEVYTKALDEVRRYHVSLVSNGNTLRWSGLSAQGKAAFVALGKTAGYRLALDQLQLPSAFVQGQPFSVGATWVNEGVAPIYEPWQVVVQLRRAGSNAVAWESASTVDLRSVLPGAPVSCTDTLTLPSTVAASTYDVALLVRDPRATRAPLQLASAGRQGDGSYRLGSIVVR